MRWEWLDTCPQVYLERRPAGRVRYLTQDEARHLLNCCTGFLQETITFALATGLRKATMRQLEWSMFDEDQQCLRIPARIMKGRVPIVLPLNDAALKVLHRRRGKHAQWVFSWQGKQVEELGSDAFRNALDRAGIDNFRWHDLRHTWASWHVQTGTPLAVLQQLGGWQNFEMVLRYAHLDHATLRSAVRSVLTVTSAYF